MKKILLFLFLIGGLAFGQWHNVSSHTFYHVTCPGTGPLGAQTLFLNGIKSLYSGKDTNTQWKFQLPSSDAPVYNTNQWSASLDWTGVSLTTTGIHMILVTDKHAISAYHSMNGPLKEAEVYFWKIGIGHHTNHVTNIYQIGSSDICVATLSNPVPADYKPVKVFNKNYTNWLPNGISTQCGTNSQLELIWVRNVGQNVYVKVATNQSMESVFIYDPVITTDGLYHPATDFADTNVVAVSGDSGSPVFITDGTSLILLTTLFHDPGDGPFISYHAYYDVLTNKIAELGKTLDEYTFPAYIEKFYQ